MKRNTVRGVQELELVQKNCGKCGGITAIFSNWSNYSLGA
jgi:hypothetical protein